MKAAVLGSPIAHSLSPALHRAGYAAAGLDGWSYTAIECAEAGLPGLIACCGPDWAGLSLTMPLKRAVLPLLDTVDPVAAGTGGANTVVLAAGQRHGYNTDVAGMVAALAE
jgi:shikimate dehydrogenase